MKFTKELWSKPSSSIEEFYEEFQPEENIETKASATEMEVLSFIGTASGNPVEKSISVSKYLWPSLEEGNIGRTISIATRAVALWILAFLAMEQV